MYSIRPAYCIYALVTVPILLSLRRFLPALAFWILRLSLQSATLRMPVSTLAVDGCTDWPIAAIKPSKLTQPR